MKLEDILKWLMIIVASCLSVSVFLALIFILFGLELFPGLTGTLLVIGRGTFIVWCIVLVIAVVDYYRKKRKAKNISSSGAQ